MVQCFIVNAHEKDALSLPSLSIDVDSKALFVKSCVLRDSYLLQKLTFEILFYLEIIFPYNYQIARSVRILCLAERPSPCTS